MIERQIKKREKAQVINLMRELRLRRDGPQRQSLVARVIKARREIEPERRFTPTREALRSGLWF